MFPILFTSVSLKNSFPPKIPTIPNPGNYICVWVEKPSQNLPSGEYLSWMCEKGPNPLNLNQIREAIKYPKTAVDKKIQGRVKVRLLVGMNGEVLKISKPTGPKVFHDEVRNSVRKLKFSPAIIEDKAVKCWVIVPFNFKLKK